MIGNEYILTRIAQHRLCKIHGWDPEIVWGFAKGVGLLKDERAANGTIAVKIGSGTISVAAKNGEREDGRAHNGQYRRNQ